MMQLPSMRTGENKLRPSPRRIPTGLAQIYLREEGTKGSARPTSKSCLVSKGPGNKGMARVVGLRRFIVRVSLPYSIKKATATYLLRRGGGGEKSWKDRDR